MPFKTYRRLIRSCCQSLIHWGLNKNKHNCITVDNSLKARFRKSRATWKRLKRKCKIICFPEPPVPGLHYLFWKTATECTLQTRSIIWTENMVFPRFSKNNLVTSMGQVTSCPHYSLWILNLIHGKYYKIYLRCWVGFSKEPKWCRSDLTYITCVLKSVRCFSKFHSLSLKHKHRESDSPVLCQCNFTEMQCWIRPEMYSGLSQ